MGSAGCHFEILWKKAVDKNREIKNNQNVNHNTKS
jgi:hypothetical protein